MKKTPRNHEYSHKMEIYIDPEVGQILDSKWFYFLLFSFVFFLCLILFYL